MYIYIYICNIYKNIEEYNPNKERKILIVLDGMIADMLNNKKLNPVITELFIKGRKLNISLASHNLSTLKILTLKALGVFKKMHCKTISFFSY